MRADHNSSPIQIVQHKFKLSFNSRQTKLHKNESVIGKVAIIDLLLYVHDPFCALVIEEASISEQDPRIFREAYKRLTFSLSVHNESFIFYLGTTLFNFIILSFFSDSNLPLSNPIFSRSKSILTLCKSNDYLYLL